MAKEYNFYEHLENSSIGIVTGLISGLFFALYIELKPQFANSLTLFGVILFVVLFYAALGIGLSFFINRKIRSLRYKKKI